MPDSFPVVLIKTDPEKRESVYKSLRNISGVSGEPIPLDGIPNFQYDTGVELRSFDQNGLTFDQNIYSKIMQIDGVVDAKMKVVGPQHGLLQGTGTVPKQDDHVFVGRELYLTQLENDAEFEEWVKKQAEKDKRFR